MFRSLDPDHQKRKLDFSQLQRGENGGEARRCENKIKGLIRAFVLALYFTVSKCDWNKLVISTNKIIMI